MHIILKDIILHGYHGMHPLENEVGTNFNVEIIINTEDVLIQSIHDTIDYEKIFLLLKEEFKKTEKLLELLAERIIQSIITNFDQIVQIEITIMKLNPPIASFQGNVGIKKIRKIKK